MTRLACHSVAPDTTLSASVVSDSDTQRGSTAAKSPPRGAARRRGLAATAGLPSPTCLRRSEASASRRQDDPSPEGLWPAGRSSGFAQAGWKPALPFLPPVRSQERRHLGGKPPQAAVFVDAWLVEFGKAERHRKNSSQAVTIFGLCSIEAMLVANAGLFACAESAFNLLP